MLDNVCVTVLLIQSIVVTSCQITYAFDSDCTLTVSNPILDKVISTELLLVSYYQITMACRINYYQRQVIINNLVIKFLCDILKISGFLYIQMYTGFIPQYKLVYCAKSMSTFQNYPIYSYKNTFSLKKNLLVLILVGFSLNFYCITKKKIFYSF